MSFSIIIIDKQNKLHLDNYLANISKLNFHVETLYCSSNECKNENVNNYIIGSNENNEKIINSVTKFCKNKNIIVVRNVEYIDKIDELIKNYTTKTQIVSFGYKQNKFKNFLFAVEKATVGKIFMHKFVQMDHGIVLYGEVASNVLKNIKSPSVLMRTNNWEGISFVLLNGGTKHKFYYNKKKSALKCIVPAVTMTVQIIVTAVFKIDMPFFVGLLYFIVFMVLLIITFIYGCRWIINSHLGENITEKANFKIEEKNENA